MKKMFGASLLGGIFLAAVAVAQDDSKPAAPQHSMPRMMEMMGKGGAMGSMEPMRAMMDMMMRGMSAEETAKMMEQCRQEMAAPPAAPENDR
jgi:hypothetical protein